jgi:antitoxin (DNA-binding transcriptional repressor) of toxin-antitoxin stability system
MYHMKTVSVRDLRYDFKTVERILLEGEEVQITKRRRAIARLVPEPAPPPKLPDFLGRLRAIYGEEILPVSGAEIVRMDRDRY